MLGINEINLLQSQNEGLKKQNEELQKENKHLNETLNQSLKDYDEFVQKMKTYDEIKEELIKTEQEYELLRKAGNLTHNKRPRLTEKIKTLKWVLLEEVKK